MHCSKCISRILRELMCVGRWRCQIFLISLSLFHSIIFLFSPFLVQWCLAWMREWRCRRLMDRTTAFPNHFGVDNPSNTETAAHNTGMWNLLFDFPLCVSERPSVWFFIFLIRRLTGSSRVASHFNWVWVLLPCASWIFGCQLVDSLNGDWTLGLIYFN
jgi:hypothetical protein